MKTLLTVRGNVATAPRRVVTDSGMVIADFRLAATERVFNRQTQDWEDGNTSWYTVSAFRHLAENIFRSLSVGDPVVVSGKLSIKEWTSKDQTKKGTTPEIIADTAGHDLVMGFTDFTRHTKTKPTLVADDSPDGPLVDQEWEDDERMTA